MCYCPTPTLHLNLALTGDGAFIFSLKKTNSVWFISVLNYGDTENVLVFMVMGTFHRRNGFYTVQTVCATLHLPYT